MRPSFSHVALGKFARNVTGRPSFNPFYVLLVVSGIAFAVTACAYGVMTFVELRQSGPRSIARRCWSSWNRHGSMLLAGELAVLAVATVGAITTDRFWQRPAARPGRHPAAERPHEDD